MFCVHSCVNMLLAANPQFCGAYCPGLLFPTVINEIPVLFLWYVAKLLALWLLHIPFKRELSLNKNLSKANKHKSWLIIYCYSLVDLNTFEREILAFQHCWFWQLYFPAEMLKFQQNLHGESQQQKYCFLRLRAKTQRYKIPQKSNVAKCIYSFSKQPDMKVIFCTRTKYLPLAHVHPSCLVPKNTGATAAAPKWKLQMLLFKTIYPSTS